MRLLSKHFAHAMRTCQSGRPRESFALSPAISVLIASGSALSMSASMSCIVSFFSSTFSSMHFFDFVIFIAVTLFSKNVTQK